MSLPFEGLDVFNVFKPQPALLAVHLLDVTQPKAPTAAAAAGQTAGQTSIFDPSLSLQRRRLVSDLVKQQGAAVVVDVGCGEGALIKHLLCDCGFTNLRRIVGVDVSSSALAAAARKLDNMNSQWLAVEQKSDQPDVQKSEGDMAAQGGTEAVTGTAGGSATAAAADVEALERSAAHMAAAAAGRGVSTTAAALGAAAAARAAAADRAEAPMGSIEGEGSTLTGQQLRGTAAAAAAAGAGLTGGSSGEGQDGGVRQVCVWGGLTRVCL